MAKNFTELKESVKDKLQEITNQVGNKGIVRVGFLEGSTGYYNGKSVPIPMIAAIQNFGAPRRGIPPRPFFTNFIKENVDSWGPGLAHQLKVTNFDVEKSLALLGAVMQGQLKDSITNTNEPPLSETTLLLRQMRSEGGANFVVTGSIVAQARARVKAGERAVGVSTKPLIDSGQLQQAVDFQVLTE